MNGALSGLRILNTRPRQQAGELDHVLREHGATPVSFPCIEVVVAEPNAEIDAEIDCLKGGGYDWIAFTSVNAVRAFAEHAGIDRRSCRARVAAVGPQTEAAVTSLLRLDVAFVPSIHSAVALASTLPDATGTRILFPTSDLAGSELETVFASRGAIVTRITVYRTRSRGVDFDVLAMLRNGKINAAIFASPSAVEAFVTGVGHDRLAAMNGFGLPAVCIGPRTARAARAAGFQHVSTSSSPSVAALIDTLASTFATHPPGGTV